MEEKTMKIEETLKKWAKALMFIGILIGCLATFVGFIILVSSDYDKELLIGFLTILGGWVPMPFFAFASHATLGFAEIVESVKKTAEATSTATANDDKQSAVTE